MEWEHRGALITPGNMMTAGVIQQQLPVPAMPLESVTGKLTLCYHLHYYRIKVESWKIASEYSFQILKWWKWPNYSITWDQSSQWSQRNLWVCREGEIHADCRGQIKLMHHISATEALSGTWVVHRPWADPLYRGGFHNEYRIRPLQCNALLLECNKGC